MDTLTEDKDKMPLNVTSCQDLLVCFDKNNLNRLIYKANWKIVIGILNEARWKNVSQELVLNSNSP